MYCFTYASSYDCVFNELILWSDISSEHPIVAKTIAELSGKELPRDIEDALANVNRDFAEFKEKVIQTREQQLKKLAPEDKVWQTLMGHFIEEQTFMKKLFEDLKLQIE